jgi:hypothetical protein
VHLPDHWDNGCQQGETLTTLALNRATFRITLADLEFMVSDKETMPAQFQGYQVVREGVLDNQMMAEHGFTESTAERFREAGRLGGFMREFGPTANMPVFDGFDFIGATVAHLFEKPDDVFGWMHEVFIKDFEDNVGNSVGDGHQLVSVQRLETSGFYDEAVALKVLQGSAAGLLSSTVIDFQVGRILGVAFVGSVGDQNRLDLASELAHTLEKRIVQVVLGSA